MEKIVKKKLIDLSVFSRDAKILLLVNTLYSLVIPLDIIFSNAFIWRQRPDFALLFTSNCSGFIGVPVGYIVNGFLLRRFRIKNIFFLSMMGCVMALMTLFFLEKTSYPVVITLGFVTGTGMGIYWSCRMYMALMKTNDENRNYFNSIELFATVIADILTAFSSGFFIGHSARFGFKPNQAYQVVIVLALLLVLFAGLILRKGNFRNPVIRRFLYFHFIPRWNQMRLYSLALGIVEGCTLILPTLLILKFLGNESSLGVVESASTLISISVVYLAGRFSSPANRTQMVIAAVVIIFCGSSVFGLMYSALGVIFFQVSFILSKPLQELAFRSTLMRSVDFASSVEKRDEYAYLIDNECIRLVGRLGGAGVFMFLYFRISEEMALRVALVLLTLILANTIWLSKKLNPSNSEKDAVKKTLPASLLTI
ncbi:MAG TPA: MFS transporter [Puia sp.]